MSRRDSDRKAELILLRTRSYVVAADLWCQGAKERRSRMKRPYRDAPTARGRICLAEALRKAGEDEKATIAEKMRARVLLLAVIRRRDLVAWNDAKGRTHRDVLDALARAALLARDAKTVRGLNRLLGGPTL